MIFSYCPFCQKPLVEWLQDSDYKITRDFYCTHNHKDYYSYFTISTHMYQGNIVHFSYKYFPYEPQVRHNISLYANQWDTQLYVKQSGTVELSNQIELTDHSWLDWDWSSEPALLKQINIVLTFL